VTAPPLPIPVSILDRATIDRGTTVREGLGNSVVLFHDPGSIARH